MRRLRRFLNDRSGATALEFSLVVFPMITMMLAMFEFGLVYLVQVSLDDATTVAARQIRTGEAQAANVSASTFKTAICNRMAWLKNSCPTSLYVDVRTLTSFKNPGTVDPIVGGQFQSQNLTYSNGTACSIVIVRSFYQWPLITYALRAGLSKMTGGVDVITATTAFRNEPFDTASSVQC